MTVTNIKGLPPGNYFTESGYSQSYPWVETGRSPSGKSVHLAKVEVKGDPEWASKKEFYPGGFCGHTPNQSEQTWLFDKINQAHKTVVRMTKKGWAHAGVQFTEGMAREFYDYNF